MLTLPSLPDDEKVTFSGSQVSSMKEADISTSSKSTSPSLVIVTVYSAEPFTEAKEYGPCSASKVAIRELAALAGVKAKTDTTISSTTKNGRACRLLLIIIVTPLQPASD